jgi:hypothetical protein
LLVFNRGFHLTLLPHMAQLRLDHSDSLNAKLRLLPSVRNANAFAYWRITISFHRPAGPKASVRNALDNRLSAGSHARTGDRDVLEYSLCPLRSFNVRHSQIYFWIIDHLNSDLLSFIIFRILVNKNSFSMSKNICTLRLSKLRIF